MRTNEFESFRCMFQRGFVIVNFFPNVLEFEVNIMIRNFVTCSVLGILCVITTPLLAQVAAYNPYAPPEPELPAVSADGTLHWPLFYRSMKMELSYERLWSIGACRGTNKRISVPAEQNRLSIDAMPEGNVEGQVVQVGQGVVIVRTANGNFTQLVTHPQGVSRVNVSGDVPASMLRPGMIVRMAAKVDDRGIGAAPIRELDVISPSADLVPEEVEANTLGTITAKVVSLRANHLRLLAGTGSLRQLSFQLDQQAVAHVMAHELGFVSVDDSLTATGHMYTGSGSPAVHWVFASDVTVVKGAATETARGAN